MTEFGRLLPLPAVPNIPDRDVYLCGPPAMIEIAGRYVRVAGVRRRHSHTECFAF
jgi:ferredoxin-NADP reductase